jgi:hypothetical protein
MTHDIAVIWSALLRGDAEPGGSADGMPYAGGMVRYREICTDVAARGYEGFRLS